MNNQEKIKKNLEEKIEDHLW